MQFLLGTTFLAKTVHFYNEVSKKLYPIMVNIYMYALTFFSKVKIQRHIYDINMPITAVFTMFTKCNPQNGRNVV